jgi:hypothetical protein
MASVKRAAAMVMFTGLALAPSSSHAEFIVNSTRDSTQRAPRIASDGGGGAYVVWTAFNQIGPSTRGDIVMRRVSPDGSFLGPEVIVNSSGAGDQERPAVASGPGGLVYVVWASRDDASVLYDIRARRFVNGAAQGDEFTVNTTTAHSQTCPDVDIDGNGTAVIVWESWFQDGSDRAVIARRIDLDGQFLGDEFQVNEASAYSQCRPAVSVKPDGSFVVVWESWKQEQPSPSGYGVFGRMFDPAGSPASGEFQVNTTTVDYQWYADVLTIPGGGFVVAWCSWEQDGADGAVVLQRFDAGAQKAGGEILVNSTVPEYQWLPRLEARPDGGFVAVWSSWKQDGDREGVYAMAFTPEGRKESFEMRVNSRTSSFQWEPDAIVLPDGRLFASWSSWGEEGKDYEVMAGTLDFTSPQGYLDADGLEHPAGHSTSGLIVHVVDSLQLSGHTYEVFFDTLASARQLVVSVRDTTIAALRVDRFPVDRGEGIFYATAPFDGLALQLIPELDLDLDYARSYSTLPSGTTLQFGVTSPTAGVRLIAPIDAAVVWGPTDTLSDGSYATPGDSAINTSGKVVATPFRGWNLTDHERMEMLIVERTQNFRWDAGERILFRTPVRYRKQANNTHAEITNVLPPTDLRMPAQGDSNIVRTTRPLSPADRYLFTASRSRILEAGQQVPRAFTLEQNYPNPFNPETRIRFTLAKSQHATLRVFDLLGREVAVLIDEMKAAGQYEVSFPARDRAIAERGPGRLATGVYLCRLSAGDQTMIRKMLLVK